MGVSRVDYDNEILIDISNDTVTSELLAEGETAHNSNGELVEGTFPIGEVDTQADLISQIKSALVGKTAGGGGSGSGIIDVTELPTENIDENAVYRVTESTPTGETNCYIKMSSTVWTMQELLQSGGSSAVVQYYVVDELPSAVLESDLETGTKVHIYIVRSTGIAYFKISGEVITVGQWGFSNDSSDKGITEDAYTETSNGVYTTIAEIRKYFVRENGVWAELGGKNSGGENVSDLFIATCDVDLATMTVSNLSHSSEEMINAHNSGKAVKIMCNTQLSGMPAIFIANPVAVVDIAKTIVFNGLFHDGANLMYLQLTVMGTGSMITPLVIPNGAVSGVSLNE